MNAYLILVGSCAIAPATITSCFRTESADVIVTDSNIKTSHFATLGKEEAPKVREVQNSNAGVLATRAVGDSREIGRLC